MSETVFVVQSVKLCYGELIDSKVEGVFDSLDKATKVKEKLEDGESDFEIKRLREALELIAKAKFYFARGEEEKQIRSICEIAKEALKGKEE